MSITDDHGTHFAFGENWRDFASGMPPEAIERATADLQGFVGRLDGMSVLDIGCGSGLHSLAACRLGAAVTAIDIDPVSVETARQLLNGQTADVRVGNVFDLKIDPVDLVYSWGVLHHTGDMWRAIEAAAGLVRPGGQLAIALYVRTPLCGFWRWEKRLYSSASRPLQNVALAFYVAMHGLKDLLRGRNPVKRFRRRMAKTKARGMNYLIDKRDWLGGYPYESASTADVVAFVERLGFGTVKVNEPPKQSGIFGATNAEYLFRRLVR